MTRADPYAGLDLLADVFDGTADAPLPVGMRDRGFGCRWLWPSPDDPRWQVEMRFLPNGDLSWVGDIRPRGAQTPKITELTPEPLPTVPEAVLDAPRRSQGPGNGNGGES